MRLCYKPALCPWIHQEHCLEGFWKLQGAQARVSSLGLTAFGLFSFWCLFNCLVAVGTLTVNQSQTNQIARVVHAAFSATARMSQCRIACGFYLRSGTVHHLDIPVVWFGCLPDFKIVEQHVQQLVLCLIWSGRLWPHVEAPSDVDELQHGEGEETTKVCNSSPFRFSSAQY